MFVWSYGLAEFLRHSNEDAICASFISKAISRTLRVSNTDPKEPLRIADLGCGPGSKAIRTGQHLARLGVRTVWDMIDVDEKWSQVLAENTDRAVTDNMNFEVRCPMSAEAWARSSRPTPHVAQFVQVAYDDETEEMVYDLTRDLTSRKSIVLVSTEHPKSDLHLIRKKLGELGYGGLPSARIGSLITRFKAQGLIVKQHTLDKQYLDIGPIGGRFPDWLWDLIIGTRHHVEDEPELTEIVTDFCKRGFVSSVNSCILSVPDLLITVRQRR